MLTTLITILTRISLKGDHTLGMNPQTIIPKAIRFAFQIFLIRM
jgi:hypothetical protein